LPVNEEVGLVLETVQIGRGLRQIDANFLAQFIITGVALGKSIRVRSERLAERRGSVPTVREGPIIHSSDDGLADKRLPAPAGYTLKT
jgi:hypothetical protein